jgi:hypothetical protein
MPPGGVSWARALPATISARAQTKNQGFMVGTSSLLRKNAAAECPAGREDLSPVKWFHRMPVQYQLVTPGRLTTGRSTLAESGPNPGIVYSVYFSRTMS